MTSIKHRILNYLEVVGRPQYPREIAQNTKINPNTVRARLSELRKRGDIHHTAPGQYTIDPTYGVGAAAPPRVQNLRVTARGVPVTRTEAVVRELPGLEGLPDDVLRIRITFGMKRGVISYTVKAPRGLDLYGLRLVHELVEMEAWLRGHVDLDWRAVNFEFLWDERSIHLEGVQAVTFNDLMGTMEKYYNKGLGVRRELRGSKPARVQDLEALIQGGITSHQAMQGMAILRGEVQHLTEAVKAIHYQYRDMLEMFKASQEASMRLVTLVDNLLKSDNTGQVGQLKTRVGGE